MPIGVGLGLGVTFGGSVATAGLVVSNQSISYGALTLASAGGAKALNASGAEVDFISVDSVVSGTGTGWSVSGGRLIRSSTPETSNGAVLRCTTTFGVIDVTIVTIANAYSVAAPANIFTQLKTVGELAGLAYGDQILCRTGTYGSGSYATIKRSTAPTGTFTPPTVADDGTGLSTGNYVIIKPHSGAVATIPYIDMNGQNNGGVGGFHLNGLIFNRTAVAAIATPLISPMVETTLIANIAVSSCTFSANPLTDDDDWHYSGIYGAAGATANIKIINNTFLRCWTSIYISQSCANFDVIGNDMQYSYDDIFKFSPANNQRIHWNILTNKKDIETSYGGHADFIQVNQGSMTAIADNISFVGNRLWRGAGAAPRAGGTAPIKRLASQALTNPFTTVNASAQVTVTDAGHGLSNGNTVNFAGASAVGGITIDGTYTISNVTGTTYTITHGSAATSGTTGGGTVQIDYGNDGLDGQGIFGSGATYAITNLVVRGNMYLGVLVRGISFGDVGYPGATDPIVEANTIMRDLTINDSTTGIFFASNGTTTGGTVRFNVTGSVSNTQSGTVVSTPNTLLAQNTTVYAAQFVNPAADVLVTDLAAQFANFPGGTADTEYPKHGATPYVNYAARTYDFPWMDSGYNVAGQMTDQTGLALSTLTTSNTITISGVSATGTLVSVSAGATLQVYDASNNIVRAYSSANYVLPNGYKFSVQRTSSPSGSVAVNTTVSVGSTTDTWSITTAAGTSPVVVTYASSAQGFVGATTKTYTSQGIGTASSDRVVAVAVMRTDPNQVITSMTIGGISAAQAISRIGPANTNKRSVDIWYAAVPTGTTANIAIDFGASNQSTSIAVYAITGGLGSTPVIDGAGGSNVDATNTYVEASATVAANSGQVLAMVAGSVITGVTWSVGTEDTDVGNTAVQTSAAHIASTVSSGSITARATCGSASVERVLAIASFK